MDSVKQQLERIFAISSGKPKKEILVLGAGIAGLSAAHELLQLGHQVQVIEASDRVGGRILTKRFATGEYHEFGAMRIPASHDYTRHYISVAGLRDKLRRFVTSHNEPNCFYHFRGQAERIRSASASILRRFYLSDTERRIVDTMVAPAIFGVHLGNLLSTLSDQDMLSLFGECELTARMEKLDQLSLGQFLDENVSGADAKELIGVSTGLEVWWDKALSMFLRDAITQSGEGLQEIVGGMDLLPNALADICVRPLILFNTEVLAIHRAEAGAVVFTKRSDSDGPILKLQADHIVCTIPFGVLRRLELHGFSAPKLRAIRNLNYASSTKVLLHCKDRFWEQGDADTRILGGASFSDGITRATYYPSDHAPEVQQFAQPSSEKAIGFRGTHTNFSTARMASSEVPRSNPGVLVGSYNWGVDARRLGALSKKERANAVMDVIQAFHPSIREFVDDADSMFWDAHRWSRGAFCFMAPGDLKSYYQAAVKSEGGVHFAGEHCSLDQGWMQGAIISGLRAVEEIVAA